MQSRISRFALPLLIGSLTLASPLLSQAADPQSDDPVATAGDTPSAAPHRQHDPAAFVQKRLDRLKSDLHITAEQEPQWSAFSSSVMQQVEQMKAAHQGARTAGQGARAHRPASRNDEAAARELRDDRPGREDAVRGLECRSAADRRQAPAQVSPSSRRLKPDRPAGRRARPRVNFLHAKALR